VRVVIWKIAEPSAAPRAEVLPAERELRAEGRAARAVNVPV
jgi:hypothetical protein